MERNFTKYIWRHTRLQQIWILCVVAISMLPYYLSLDLPKLIVNGPIQGEGFTTPGATQAFMPATLDLPYVGDVSLIGQFELGRMQTLVGLSLAFLALVIINGLFKYYINTFKGLLGERLLRRIRFELVDRVLRFKPGNFKHIKSAEVASMVKDEIEPLGGFTGDAFVQPALLGGQALTALAFIFVQNVWLGMVAAFMAGVQIAIIPALRRRLIQLGRERQITARELSGRVAEIVDGISTIHAYDTSNYERSDISRRLGRIFRIRFEIYQRKFIVKFLNNFLAQLTPFLFYLIGGYFTIQGTLDVGQLVAVINAYKELPGPLKELIDWDLARQDVQVKYEQVVEQFHDTDTLEEKLFALTPANDARIAEPLVLSNLTVEDDSGTRRLDRVNLTLTRGETVAVFGESNSGVEALAEVLGRVTHPTSGRLTVGDDDLFELPEALTGRRITYASADTFFFGGTLRDNLLYGLKNAPQAEHKRSAPKTLLHKRDMAEAVRAGNPVTDYHADWIDPERLTGWTPERGTLGSAMAVLDLVRLSDQVIEFALFSTVDAEREPGITNQIIALRPQFREELARRGMSDLVVPFEAGSYNTEARVVDNLLFGVLTPEAKDPEGMAEGTRLFQKVIMDSGLGAQLFTMGMSIAETTLELFQGLRRDHPFYERLNYMDPDDIPMFEALLQKLKGVPFAKVDAEDRLAMIQLSYLYIEPRHRFGILDEALMKKIVEVRETFHAAVPADLAHLFQQYDPAKYQSSATLLDNIVFGKVNHRFNDSDRQVREVVAGLMQNTPGFYDRVFDIGLDYNLGAAGRRLTVVQRQKLNLARALIRKSDFYVFNRPLSALDPALNANVLRDTLAYLARESDHPGVIWVVASRAFAKEFQRLVQVSDHVIVDPETEGTGKPKPAIFATQDSA